MEAGGYAFISYSTKNQKTADAMRDLLKESGIKTWMAPGDIPAGSKYAKVINRAVKDCACFILVLSEDSQNSVWVAKEVERAVNYRKPIIPIQIEDVVLNDEFELYISTDQVVMIKEIKKIIASLRTYVKTSESENSADEIDKGIVLNSCGSTNERYSLIDKRPNPRNVFIGRKPFLDEIDEIFNANKRVLFLEGIGGIGKSEIAKQYAVLHSDEYDTVMFLSYSDSILHLVCSPNAIEIDNFSLNSKESERELFERKLRVFRSLANERTLLIVDNFDVDDDPDIDEFMEGSHRIIFTTRNPHPGQVTLKINAITDEDALIEIFEKNLERSVSEEDKKYLIQLFKLVSYHTYMIELLAKQMKEDFSSCQELYEKYKNGHLAMLNDDIVAGRNGRDANTVFGHIRTLFAINRFSEEELMILRELSLIGSGGIPKMFYFKWSSCKNVRGTLRYLIDRGLVYFEEGDCGQKFSLHSLVSEIVKNTEEMKPTAENCRMFLQKMCSDLYAAWYMTLREKTSIADCVSEIAKYFKPFYFEAEDRKMFSVWATIPSFLWQVGRFDESIRVGHEVYESSLSVCGTNSMFTGHAAKTLGGCYHNSKKIEKSIEWYKQGLKCMLASKSEINEDFQIIYEKVARCYTWEFERDFAKAEALFKKSLEIGKELLDKIRNGAVSECFEESSPSTAENIEEHIGETYMEMGRMYRLMGDYSKALEYIEKYEEIIQRVASDNISGMAYVFFDKGLCHYQIGMESCVKEDSVHEFHLAIKYLSKALEFNKKMRGAAVDTLNNEELLADSYRAVGNNDEAYAHYNAAIGISIKLFGEENTEKERLMKKICQK